MLEIPWSFLDQLQALSLDTGPGLGAYRRKKWEVSDWESHLLNCWMDDGGGKFTALITDLAPTEESEL